ncbi:type IV pilin [Methanofollis formosanus]|uniref:Type IV pilin n=1 Tax=Methanofollis formosanus TaxID=299308 RepID=A0A8G1EGY6_9EURY|nr:type IV pilin N-terminal domain-containing protein [Methanofollis formosanus]QYZ80323.1 type IV pilin [Methanofollis formosanus]
MRITCEEAVSEVIGVMLMISVTLVIVGLVAVYATGAASGDEQPIRASLLASEVAQGGDGGYQVVFEHMAGDPFTLDQLEVSLGIRDDLAQHIVVRNDPGKPQYLQSYAENGKDVLLGDRFVLCDDGDGSKKELSWQGDGGAFTVEEGHYLTYRFIDRRTGAPVSSGEIAVEM